MLASTSLHRLRFVAALALVGSSADAGVITTGAPIFMQNGMSRATTGSLTIDGGSTFHTTGIETAIGPSDVYTVTITDPGSRMILDGTGTINRLSPGNWGAGYMSVLNGAVVDATGNRAGCASGWCNNFVANAAGGFGQLTIDGAGSRVDLINTFSVGQATVFTAANDGFDFGTPGAGSTGIVDVTGGGVLNVEQALIGWAPAGPSSPAGLERGIGNVTVAGAGSQFNIVGDAIGFSRLDLGAGVGGSGNLFVHDGGSVRIASNISAGLFVGREDAARSSLVIDGVDSQLVVDNVSPQGFFASSIDNASAAVTNGGLLRLINQSLSVGGTEADSVAVLRVAGDGSSVDVGDGFVIVGAASRQGVGLVQLDGGAIAGNVFVDDHGLLAGNGAIAGDLYVAGGIVGPGFSPGRIDVLGDLKMSDGLLDFQFSGFGADQYDHLNVLGAVNITGGTISLSFMDGFLPDFGAAFDFLTFTDANAIFENASFTLSGLPSDFLYSVDLVGDASSRGFRFTSLAAQAVPEPATLPLLIAGLLASGWLSRRRIPGKTGTRGADRR